MNFAEHRTISEGIQLSPWNVLCRTSNKVYLHKINFSSSSYNIFVTDGIHMWEENVEKDMFSEKAQRHNPNIEADTSMLLNYVKVGFEESVDCKKIYVSEKDDVLDVSFQCKVMATIPFTWSFQMKKLFPCTLYEEFIQPLVIMLEESMRRQRCLATLLQQKDREIQDYKDHGATISRKHLETFPYDSLSFESISNLNEEFVANCRANDIVKVIANEESKKLYRAVMLNKQSKESNLPSLHPENRVATFDTASVVQNEGYQVTSWNEPERLPISLMNETGDAPTEPTTSGLTPEKEKEQERREALRKRLQQESENKTKKKKRKIKI